MARSRKYEVGVGCLMLVAAAVLAVMAVKVGALGSFGERIEVSARFSDAAGLQPGASVAIAGVEVGTLSRMELDRDAAIVVLGIKPEAHIGRDARVRIRARSVLGEKYLEVLPGSPDAPLLQEGDRLEVEGEQVEIDELVLMLAPVVRAVDPEKLSDLLGRLEKRLDEDPLLLDRLVNNADRLLANAAEASEQVPELVIEGRTTLSDTRVTLREVRARAQEGEAVVARADRVLSTIEKDLPELADRAESVLNDAGELVGSLEESSGDLKIVLSNLSEIDKTELRRLLREEGVLIRFRSRSVPPTEEK